MVAGSWDQILQEWCIDTKHCCAAALAQTTDYQLYAAAPVADDAGWGLIYKEDHDEQIMQQNGNEVTEVTVKINEAATLKEAIESDMKISGPSKNGFWIGGEKYKVVQRDPEFESKDSKFTWVLATRPKKGVHILATKASVLICMYNEDQDMTSGNCKNHAISMAEYLVSEGL